ncbi:MAG: chromosomal replication initiator protein DnaA [Acidobacteria bacterium]|nr:chromosomal replication initiator protein DnaA [Acidobacteriota bacterium]
MELWNNVLACIEKRITPQNFEIWFKSTSLLRHDPKQKRIFVRVPNKHFKHWLAENYMDVIADSLREMEMESFRVSFLVDERETESDAPTAQLNLKDPCLETSQYRLNPKCTFATFVVGFCNQFANAAALAVAERPSKTYNPLFIYGGVGLGKTHLMHAIGHCVKQHSPHLRLTYMSSERFMNELINSIRYDKTVLFREKYRNIDVLLMDDIQFLAGKERTQEEFFHTFNALYDAQKQIVISSDSPPKQIPTLEERLHSRFEWGLIADLQPPDLETKVAILKKKAELEGVALNNEVALFIANNIRSNVRELEGSLVRLVAYSSLTGQEITLTLAKSVLKNIVEPNSRTICVELIQKIVAEHFSLKPSDLKAKNNSRRISEPRQIAMFLCKELVGSSLPQIGKDFGGKHHTTVLHSIRKVEQLKTRDLKLNNTLNKLISLLS